MIRITIIPQEGEHFALMIVPFLLPVFYGFMEREVTAFYLEVIVSV